MLTTHIMRNNTILLQMQAIEITTTEMAKNKAKTNKKNLFCSDADYGDYDYPSSTGCGAGGCGGGADGQGFGGIQPRKGGRSSSVTVMSIIFPHFEVMGERGAMWWAAPPSLPCPDKDLVQSVLNLQKQPLREKGITKDVKIFGFRCLT